MYVAGIAHTLFKSQLVAVLFSFTPLKLAFCEFPLHSPTIHIWVSKHSVFQAITS